MEYYSDYEDTLDYEEYTGDMITEMGDTQYLIDRLHEEFKNPDLINLTVDDINDYACENGIFNLEVIIRSLMKHDLPEVLEFALEIEREL
jgi:hypothetical protein